MSSLKVLIVIDTLETGGAEKSILAIASRLTLITPVVVVLYNGLSLLPEYEQAGLRVITLNIPGKYNFLRAIRAFSNVIQKEKPDVVHATLFRSELVARFSLRKTSIPLICSFVNDSYSPERYSQLSFKGKLKLTFVKWVDRITAKWSSHFMSITKSIVATNCKAIKINPDKVTVIYRGRDVTFNYTITGEKRNQLMVQFGGKFTFITVARLLLRKGLLESIEAFALVANQYPDVRYLIAGEGHDRSCFENKIKKLGLIGKVFLLGTRTDVSELLAYSDVFVFPSHYEGHGGALVEAMLAAKPIIGSDIEVVKESIENNKTGLLFRLRDVNELAKKMIWTIEHVEQAKAMGKLAREKAIGRFNIVDIAHQHEELYLKVFANNNKKSIENSSSYSKASVARC